jgi:cell division protease FtsH
MKGRAATVVLCVMVALLLLALYNLFSVPTSSRRLAPVVDYSSFIADVDGGRVEETMFRGGTGILVRRKDGQMVESYLPHVQVIPTLTDRLLAKGVTVSARPTEEDVPSAISLLASWLPLLLFYALLYLGFARPLVGLARQIEAFVKVMRDQSPRPPSSPA